MPESASPVKTSAIIKRHARAFEKSEFIRYLQEADLSDARRYFELARLATRQHDKSELMAGATVGIVVALLVGGGTLLGTIITGLSAFVATIVVVFVIHWIRAPSAFYKLAQSDLKSTALLLKEEKARRVEPKLEGKILCLSPEAIRHSTEPVGNYGDCWFTMSVNLWNGGVVGTTVTGFRFYADWKGTEWPARQIEGLDKFRARSFRPSDPGSSERYVDEYENLFDFHLPSEITVTNNKRGWLRFVIRNFPLSEGQHLDDNTAIRLVALDKKGEPHTVY